MSSNLYKGKWDMSDLNVYVITCTHCLNDVGVVGPVKVDEGKTKNVGRYYYSCNTINCNFFRWFEHKWPKVCHMILNENKINSELDEITEIFKSVSIHTIDKESRLLLISKLNSIIEKLKKTNEISKKKM